MSDSQLYREQLLAHYRQPRHKGDLSEARFVRRGRNPRCGDDLEVGLDVEAGVLSFLGFRGRGCSVCLASASLMAETLQRRPLSEAVALGQAMRAWMQGEWQEPPDAGLAPLAAVRHHPARQRCVLLCWEALSDALAAALAEADED